MPANSIDRLRQLIQDLTGELAVAADEVRVRALGQTLALLHAAAETLDELEKKRAPRPPRPAAPRLA
jgi:hypothetical protein